MEWTLGSLMFYGGIGGGVLTLLALIVAKAALSKSKKRVVHEMQSEYGGVGK